MPGTPDAPSNPGNAASFRSVIKNAGPDVNAAFAVAFDPSLLAADRKPRVTNEHHGRFQLAGGGSVTLDTNGGESRFILPSTINGDLPPGLRRQAILLQGERIPGSERTASAHVLPLDNAQPPIKEQTLEGPVVTVVFPGELTENGTLDVPVVRVSPKTTSTEELRVSYREAYSVDPDTEEPVARRRGGFVEQAAQAALQALEPEARKAVTNRMRAPLTQ